MQLRKLNQSFFSGFVSNEDYERLVQRKQSTKESNQVQFTHESIQLESVSPKLVKEKKVSKKRQRKKDEKEEKAQTKSRNEKDDEPAKKKTKYGQPNVHPRHLQCLINVLSMTQIYRANLKLVRRFFFCLPVSVRFALCVEQTQNEKKKKNGKKY